MLRERDQLEIVYLTTLRMKIVELAGLSGDEKNNIFGKIDSEVTWYKDHKEKYKDGDSLEDLFNKSAESESRHKTVTLAILYESLFTVSLGEEKGIRQNQEDIYGTLRSLVEENVKNGKLDMNPFNRWFSDIDSTISTLKQNEDQGKSKIQGIYNQHYNIEGIYSESVDILSSSVKSLSQLNNFLTEVLTSIKNQL